MPWFRRVLNVFRSRRHARELDAELSFHIAERVDDLVAQGVERRAARREAVRRFGNYTALKERTRDMDVSGWLSEGLRDLKYGGRQLRLNPGFASVAVFSLALGIGANTGMFQLINALRLQALPVSDASQLVVVERAPGFMTSGWYEARNSAFTFAQYQQVEEHQQALSGLLAFATWRFSLSERGQARHAEGLFVTPNFFEELGIAPALGTWLPADADPRDCGTAGAVLSDAFWRREFGRDPSVVGRSITLNGHRLPVLGVTPASFYGLERAYRFDVAVPLCADGLLNTDRPGRLETRTAWWLTMIGRLKPDWTVERASAHFGDISPVVFRESVPDEYRPDTAKAYLANRLRVASAAAGVSLLRREYEGALWLMLGTAALVLLIACANLANLLLARARAREREAVLRLALGASRRRLVRQLMTESVLLAGLGAVLGAALASGLSRGLVAFMAQEDAQLYLPIGVDWRVFAFVGAAAVGTCLLFGLGPAFRSAAVDAADSLRGGRGVVRGERQGFRRVLVVSQIALSFVLLVGALLFVQTLRNLQTVPTGMDTEGILMATVNADAAAENRLGEFQELAERTRALPDVVSASAAQLVPFSGSQWNEDVHPDVEGGESRNQVWFNRVAPSYFETLRTPLVAGRDFTAADRAGTPLVAIVNEEFARMVFGESNPVGRRFRYEAIAGEADPVFQVVGLVGNTKYLELREETRPIAFLPLAQDDSQPTDVTLVVRARGDFAGVMRGIQRHMADQGLRATVEFEVLDEQIARSLLRERLVATLSAAFGVLAIVLSTLGLYGVMSYLVARRRSEIGVRMALGATTGDVLRMVLSETGGMLVSGLAVGVVGAFGLSRFAASLLFGLTPNDAVTLALAGAVLVLTALAATFTPARRAARLDPATVLRSD